MAKRARKTSAQLEREISAGLARRGGLRDLIRRARSGEPGADLVAGDAIMASGYTPERARKVTGAYRPPTCAIKQAVAKVQAREAEQRAERERRAAERVPAGATRKANDQIADLVTNRYFESIPLDKIFGIVERAGFRFNPDERPLFLTGRKGHETWNLYSPAGRPANHMLVMSWYKMEQTGRYEVVAYVS